MPDSTKYARDDLPAGRFGGDMGSLEARPRSRGGNWAAVAELLQELRYTFRRLRKAPVFSTVVILSIGLGIGATTSIFSVVKGVLLDPLPYPDAHRLVALWNTAPGVGEDRLGQPLAINAVYEDRAASLEHVGLWTNASSVVTGPEGPEDLPSVLMTQGILPALGVGPFLGRGFTFDDTQTSSARTVILAHDFWLERYGGDPGVLGRSLVVSDLPREIIGVMPAGFRVMDSDAAFYLPYRYDKASLAVTNFSNQSIARLADGVTEEKALQEMKRLLPMALELYPGGLTLEMLEELRGEPVLAPLKAEVIGSVGSVLWVVLGGVAIILFVALANAANLLLVKAEARERVLAVQAALGSSRRRVVSSVLGESVAIGALGGTLGVGLAWSGVHLMHVFGPADLPRLGEIDLDIGVLAFAFLLSVGVGFVLGLLPLARTLRINLAGALKDAGRGTGQGPARSTARNTLVVAQLAMAVVLLIGSGLMVRTFVSLTRVEPGFTQPEQLLTFAAVASNSEFPDMEDVAPAHRALAERLANLPGVSSVGVTSSLPLGTGVGVDPVFFEDFPLPEGQQAPIRRFRWIGGDYPETMGNSVLAGRSLTWQDVEDRARVVMITESLARQVWGDATRAVGRRLSTGYEPGDWYEVAGVLADVRHDGMDQPPTDIVYWPMVLVGYFGSTTLFVQRSMRYVVRSRRVGTPGFLDEVREAALMSFPGQPMRDVRTMANYLGTSMARTSFTLVILAISAVMALILGSVGIYGVIAYMVGQRTREMGLRVAMGAAPGAVTRMVLGEGLLLAGLGAVVGVGGAVAATQMMEAILFGVSPLDPATYVIVVAAMLVTVLAASWTPARRAARVQPMEALRAE